MKEFFKEIKSDWKKIVWSDRKTLVKETVAVIGFYVVICILIMGVDTLTQYGVNFVTGLIK